MGSSATGNDSNFDDFALSDLGGNFLLNSNFGEIAPAELTQPVKPTVPRRTQVETVLVMGVVAVASLVAAQDVPLRRRVNELLQKSLRGVARSDCTVVQNGDSLALSFKIDPEVALQTAQLLRALAVQRYGSALAVRIGIHLGPVRQVMDAQSRVNLVGDGINVAQRVLDFAKSNQIVVSDAYYQLISRIGSTPAELFVSLGTHMDKHMRAHDIHAVLDPLTVMARGAPPAPVAGTADNAEPASTLDAEEVDQIAQELVVLVGPIAGVLLHKALPRASSAYSLRTLLAAAIPEPSARRAFVRH